MRLPDATVNLDGIAWGPDGMAAFAGWDDVDPSRVGIYVGDPTDPASIRQITTTPVGGNAYPLAFSPDGSRIAFVAGLLAERRERACCSWSTSTVGTRRQVSPAGSEVNGEADYGSTASWSPDGQHVAFATADETGFGRSLYVADRDGSDVREVFSSSGGIDSTSWSP